MVVADQAAMEAEAEAAQKVCIIHVAHINIVAQVAGYGGLIVEDLAGKKVPAVMAQMAALSSTTASPSRSNPAPSWTSKAALPLTAQGA